MTSGRSAKGSALGSSVPESGVPPKRAPAPRTPQSTGNGAHRGGEGTIETDSWEGGIGETEGPFAGDIGSESVPTALSTFPSYFGINDGGANGGGFYPMGDFWAVFPQGRNVGQAQFSDDYSILKGTHNIKIGIN